jgi:hypothetical protein
LARVAGSALVLYSSMVFPFGGLNAVRVMDRY